MKKIVSILLLDRFSKTLKEEDLLSVQRFRVFRITTVFCLLIFSLAIFQIFLADFNRMSLVYIMTVLFAAIFINYFVLAIHKKADSAYITLLILIFLLLHVVTYASGGIRNSGLFYFAAVILITYMLLGKKGGKVMAGFSIIHVVYFYFVSRNTDWVDYSIIGNSEDMIDLDFLITGVLSILLLTAQANYIEKSKNAIISDVRLKRDELAINNATLLDTQKKLEIKNRELEQKNLELEQFAFVSSHDLQEPLRTIADFAGLLQQRYKGKLDDKADKYLSFITQSSERMKTLIKDLLHYSQIGSEKRLESINCSILLGEVMQDIGKILKETKAEIQSSPLPLITGNPTAIKQLFQNLVINAIKFRKKDCIPEIKISALKKGAYWEFSIADNGIGIEKEHSHKIFNIFQRLNSRKEYAGSGIGLSHCKKIVELYGGRIWVKSVPGEGSTFYFTLHAASV